MNNPLADHIAQFTPKTKFLENKFIKFLRRSRRREVKRKPDKQNKQPAID